MRPAWRAVGAPGALAVLCLLCVACGGRSAPTAGVPEVLVVAQSLDDIVSLDPAEGFELSSLQVFTNVYQRLVEPSPDDPRILVPTLAARWQPGPVPHSLIFELRPDAVFASGHPVRPEDVIFSLRRAVKMNGPPVFILNELGWRADTIDAALTKVGAHAVQITWMSDVGAAFALSILTAPVASIVDAAEVSAHGPADEAGEIDDAGNAWLKRHSAGSGPFKIRRYIPHEALVLDANPTSPGSAPLLKTLIFKNVTDAATRRLLVEVGDADMARDLGPDQLAALKDKPDLETLRFPSATVHYLLFNSANRDNPALANPKLWEAARWLVDYDGIANRLLKGEFEVHQAFLADGFPDALNTTPYHLDIAKARSILAGAGLAKGLHLKLWVFNQPPYGEIAQSLQSTFGQAGVELEIVPALASEVYSKVRERSEEAVWLYWVPDYFDANSTAGAFARNPEDGTKTLAWRAGWRIPELSRETRAAVQELDPAVRQREYLAIQSAVQASSPFVIALQARSAVVVRAEVSGYQQGLDADMAYYGRVRKGSR